ncbi:MAG: ParM/StbA family protein [Lachnospiraceae bacterium]|nr:ParM/StbA family protein [Lachnospiraceae bacterium]
MNNIEVIGIDHGWSHIKTVNEVFKTAIAEIVNEPAFYDNVLEYEGKFYKVGGKRLDVKDSKVENENFYLLTLVALAKELKRRGTYEADVVLAVGLPLTRFSEEKAEFIKYLSKNEHITFKFEEKIYSVNILRVSVYPQCYAAVVSQIPTFGRRALVVDIGSWTIDYMPILDKAPDDTKCNTQNEGLIKCMNGMKRISMRLMNRDIDEVDIEEYLLTGTTILDDKYKKIIDSEMIRFTDMVYNSLIESGYNLDTTPIIFVGGGARVIKNFGKFRIKNVRYIYDVKANAKGYETLARISLRNGR